MSSSAEGLFVIEDLQNLCDNYDKTLLCWYRNFIKAWPAFADKYGERFRRMWEYYLLCCAGVFRARGVQVFQLLMTRERDARRQPAAAMR